VSADATFSAQVRVEVTPRWPFRLPGAWGLDGVTRRGGAVVQRLLHVDGAPAIVRFAQPSSGRVLLAGLAQRRDMAQEAVARMRFALGLDDDLRPFYDRWRDDPLIGRSVRASPWLRVTRRPEPFEALAWAICEQLIEYERAAAIQRRIVFRLGRRATTPEGMVLYEPPEPATIAGVAPALLQSMDLSAGRALALVRAAQEVAKGRVDLRAAEHERGWRRLRAINNIGSWTVEVLALFGQGRYDQVPAGDLALRKLVGRLRTGDPRARGEEEEVRAVFAPYEGWAGLAAAHALAARGPVLMGLRRARRDREPATDPRPGRTRSSATPGWARAGRGGS
jgi:3-methyladenine DNA glycosylase/8-oxoguanine DNA glycosylase